MRPSGRITRQGRGCLATYGIGRSQPRLSDASAHCERVAADIDRQSVSAHDPAPTIADLLWQEMILRLTKGVLEIPGNELPEQRCQ
ncbi:hypothetical protein [Rhizobium leguminosarum]|uniref:hypothetical protein n=1 Tax=Rhizobium leguminosarum TaxID=384 RepID=UPI003F9CBDD5